MYHMTHVFWALAVAMAPRSHHATDSTLSYCAGIVWHRFAFWSSSSFLSPFSIDPIPILFTLSPFPFRLSFCPTDARRREAEETAALSRLPPFGEVASFCSQGKKQKMEGAKRKLDSANGNEPSLPDGNRTLESGDQPPSDGNVLGCMGAARRRRLSPKPPSSSSSSPSPSPEPRDSQVRNLDQ